MSKTCEQILSRHGGATRLAWLCLLWLYLLPSALAARDYTVESVPNVRLSDRHDHVSDPDGILAPEAIARVNQLLDALEDSLGIEVAVVAVESIGDNDPRSFATELFNHWGLGQKGADNGLLIQLVTEPSRRSVVFETGYGIEGVLPDAICYRLQQRYMIPDMREGNYSAGMLKGVTAVTHYLLASDYERARMTGISQGKGGDLSMWMFAAFAVGALALVTGVAYLKYRPRRCPRCGKKTFKYMGRQVVREATRFSEGLAEEVYHCRNCGYTDKRTHIIDRIHPGGGGPIIMGGGGFGGFSGGGDSGGSWGGGSSGGGGSMSRF